jgi:hypothetical protein
MVCLIKYNFGSLEIANNIRKSSLKMDLHNQPLFICGHPKSGTSLLRSLLDGHPQLVVYPEESVFFRRYLPLAEKKDIETQLELAEENLIHIFTWNQENPPLSQRGFPDRDYSNISFDEIRDELRAILSDRPAQHAGDLLSAAILAFGIVTKQASAASKYWVEKSPYNEQFAAQIYAWWPNARCLHVVRDPRDNFLSYSRKHADWSAEFFAKNWTKSTRIGINNQENFGKNKYSLIRFEDLVQSPENTLTQMCQFLGIDFVPEITTPIRAGKSWAGNSMFDQEFKAISSAPVGRWREQVSASDAAVIETMSAADITAMGYSSPDHQPVSTRIRAASWPIRRRFRK